MDKITAVTYERMQSDITVNVYTNAWQYYFFHVKLKHAEHVMWLKNKGFSNQIWHLLKIYEYAKRNQETGERFVGKEKLDVSYDNFRKLIK